MVYRFAYPFNVAPTLDTGQAFTVNLASPPPGVHITGFTSTFNAPVATFTASSLTRVGGSNPGGGLASCNVGAGGTACVATVDVTDTTGSTGHRLEVIINAGYTRPYSVSGTITVTYADASPPSPCQYGTEANPDAAIYTTVTVGLVDVVTVLLGGGPLMITAFDALLGSPLFAYDCDHLPPTAPEFTDGDFLGSTGIVTPGSWWKLMDLFKVGVWHFYCRCKAATGGGPPPVMPPLPDPGPPLTDPGPQPKLPCSDADMCQVLNIIVRQINSISLNIQFNRQTNNYFPGPAQAFNYQLGAPHPGIYGSGYLDISGLVGLRVEISSRPEGTLELQGNPPYLWNMGWMSIDDTDGMLEEKRVTRDSFVWLPTHMTEAEKFGWNLFPEVVLTVWELLPAPA